MVEILKRDEYENLINEYKLRRKLSSKVGDSETIEDKLTLFLLEIVKKKNTSILLRKDGNTDIIVRFLILKLIKIGKKKYVSTILKH